MYHDYREDLVKLGIIERLYCSQNEIAELTKNSCYLPADVFKGQIDGKTAFWRYPDISNEQLLLMLKIKNTLHFRGIKYCAIVFTITAVIFLVLTIYILKSLGYLG